MRGVIGMEEFGILATYFLIFFVTAVAFCFASMKERNMIMLEDIFGISLGCCVVMAHCVSKLWIILLTPAVFIIFMVGYIALDYLKNEIVSVVSLVFKK